MVNRIAKNAYSAEDCRLHYVTSSLIMYYMTSELVTQNLKWKSELVTRHLKYKVNSSHDT